MAKKTVKKPIMIKDQALQKTMVSAADSIDKACAAGMVAITERTKDSKKLLATSKTLAKKHATLAKRAKAAAVKAKKNPGADARKALKDAEKNLASISKELKTCNTNKAANTAELSALKLSVRHLKAYLMGIKKANKDLKPVQKKSATKKAAKPKAATKKTTAKKTKGKTKKTAKSVASKPNTAVKSVAKSKPAPKQAVKSTPKPAAKPAAKPKLVPKTEPKTVSAPAPIPPVLEDVAVATHREELRQLISAAHEDSAADKSDFMSNITTDTDDFDADQDDMR